MADGEPEVTKEGKEKALSEKELGNAAYKSRDFPTAHSHYDNAIQLDPTNITFYSNKAAVFFEEEKYEDCIKSCEKAIEVGRDHRADFKLIARALARIGNAYLKEGEEEKALLHFDKSLSEHRDPELVKKRNELQKKIKEKERLAYLNPEIAEQEKLKGNDCFKQGKFPEAVRFYTEALKRNPEDAKLYSNRAACYTKLMEFNLALADCDECIKKDPDFIKAYIRKGAALMATKRPIQARDAYQEALMRDPDHAEAQEGYRQASAASASSNREEEVAASVEKNPEVQQILADPAMQMILKQMQSDPKSIQEHLQNPDIAQKIMKLMDVGVIQLGRR